MIFARRFPFLPNRFILSSLFLSDKSCGAAEYTLLVKGSLMITRVSLTNWRSHLQSELEFSEGTNCLIGRMGSGKSSVLDAICFGLFGTFPQLQQKKIKLEDMIMKKPKAQRFAEVKVFFGSNGDECSVKRRIEKGKSTSAEFRKGGRLVETQSQKVSEEVERILKVDYDLFTRAVYSEQNQLDIFLTIPKGQRMKKIDELLRLDRFEAARVSAVSLKNRFSFHMEEREKMLEGMKDDDAKYEAETLKKEIEALKSERESLVAEAEKAKEKRNIIKERIENLEKTREEIRAITERIFLLERLNSQLEDDISFLEKELCNCRSAGSAEELKLKSDALKYNIGFILSKIKNTRDAFLEKKIELGAEIERLSQLMKMKGEREKIETLLQGGGIGRMRDELNKISENIERNAVNIGSFKMEIAGCELTNSLKDRCLVCGHEISGEKRRELVLESKKKIEALSIKKTEAESGMKKLVGERKVIEKDVADFEHAELRMMEIGNLGEDIIKAEGKTGVLAKDAEGIETEIRKMEGEYALLQSEFENIVCEYESAKTYAAKMAEAAKKRETLERNIAESESLKARMLLIKKAFSEEELDEARRNMETLIGREKSIEAKLQFADEMNSEKRKRLESAEARRRIADDCRLEIRKAAAMEEQLQLLERGLEVSQEQLRKDFIGAINHAMHMIWESLYPYTDFSSARLAIDGDYILQLQDSNGWVSVDNVSGGERSIACLALRIAFALVLAPQLRWLVLDEPTHNLDEKAVAELANVLRDNLMEFVEQAFLITHDPSLETAVSGFLYRMEKEKDGFTSVVKVEGG